MSTRMRYMLPVLFVAALVLQISFWTYSRTVKPDLGIVPDVPGRAAVKALSFGDEQFFFRLLGLQIQISGDTFGRSTALYKYDFVKLNQWFILLDSLDDTSNFIPTMASYYFSQTQNRPDVRYIVDYLYRHAAHRPQTKWWWLVQATYLANHVLKDKDLALQMAKPLENAGNDVPVFARQMPAFIHEQRGEFEDAYRIMQDIQKNFTNLSPGEINFMRYFVEERLKKLDRMSKPQER